MRGQAVNPKMFDLNDNHDRRVPYSEALGAHQAVSMDLLENSIWWGKNLWGKNGSSRVITMQSQRTFIAAPFFPHTFFPHQIEFSKSSILK